VFDVTSTPRILVVDDSRAVRRYVRELLGEGYDIREAPDALRGLDLLQESPPDLLLLDIEMPGMNGLELLSRLSPDRLFSVILFTTRSSIDSIVQGLEAGADDYIVKPFDEKEFKARITAGLRSALKRRELDQARRSTEEALRALERAEQECLARERMNAIATLASGAAHQINNPLGFVLSNFSSFQRYGRLLLQALDELAPCCPDSAKEILQRYHIPRIQNDLSPLLAETFQGLKRIAMIVKGLSRLQPAMGYVQRETLDLAPMVTALIDLHGRSLPEGRRISLVRADDPVMVEVAPSFIQTVFDEILSNAVQGSVDDEIRVSVIRSGAWGEVLVANRADLPDDLDLSRLTEPFYGLRSPDEHAGLGLAIVQRFVISQRGELELSQEGGWFTVRVRLPSAGSLTGERENSHDG